MIRKIEVNGVPLQATVTTLGADGRTLRTYETETDGSVIGNVTGREHAVRIDFPSNSITLTLGHCPESKFEGKCAHKIGRAYVCNLSQSHDFHQRGSSVYRHDFV